MDWKSKETDVDSLAETSELLRVSMDASHPQHAQAVAAMEPNGIESYIQRLLDVFDRLSRKSCAIEATKENKENIQGAVCKKDNDNAKNQNVLDELIHLFHLLDVLFLFLYTDNFTSKYLDRMCTLLQSCYYGSVLTQDQTLSTDHSAFEEAKGVRKGIFVLGQTISVLLALNVAPCSDIQIDGTNALYVLSCGLYGGKHRGDGQVNAEQISKSIVLGLDWMIDILESAFCGILSDKCELKDSAFWYPNAVGVRTVMRDLLLTLMFNFERFDLNVTCNICRAMALCHQASTLLCDSLWSGSEDWRIFVMFLCQVIMSLGLDNPAVLELIQSVAHSKVGAEQIGGILADLPFLCTSRTPDRLYVREDIQNDTILLYVSRQFRITYSNIGLLLPEGTTGSQQQQDTVDANVVWNIRWNGWEFLYRLVVGNIEFSEGVIGLICTVLQYGYNLPQPQICPLFEWTKVGESLFEILAFALRRALDANCSSVLINYLLISLGCLIGTDSQIDEQKGILSDLDLFSESSRGLFFLLKGTKLSDSEKRIVLNSFINLCAKVFKSCDTIIVQFVERILECNPDCSSHSDFVCSLARLVRSVGFDKRLDKYGLFGHFLRLVPNADCILGATAIYQPYNVVLGEDLALLCKNLPATSDLLARIIPHVPLGGDCYEKIVTSAGDQVFDAIAKSNSPHHHITQLRALGLLEQTMQRTNSILFLSLCPNLNLDVINEKITPRLQHFEKLDALERRALVSVLMDNNISFDVVKVLNEAPDLADIMLRKKPSAVAVVLRNSRALSHISSFSYLKDAIEAIELDDEMIFAIRASISRDLIKSLSCSDRLISLIDSRLDPVDILAICEKVGDDSLLLKHLSSFNLLHVFFARAAITSETLPVILSRHAKLAKELVDMGLLEACLEAASIERVLIPSMLSCVSIDPDRIACLLSTMSVDIPASCELLLLLYKSGAPRAQSFVRGLLSDILECIRQFAHKDRPLETECKSCILALCLLQEMGQKVPQGLLVLLKSTPISHFSGLLE